MFYLRPVLGKNTDEPVSRLRVSSVQESRTDVLGSVRHLCKTKHTVFSSRAL